jgi:hypothetical protein
MAYNPDMDTAMANIKEGMVLLRRNSDADSILFWEALLEVNRALAIEDTERAVSYLKELLRAPLSSRVEFRGVYAHITGAYEHLNQPGRNLEDVQSIVKTIERKYGIKLGS